MEIRWECQASLWQETLDCVPQATFFHTPAWAHLFAVTHGGHVDVLHASWPDGRRAVMPVGVRPVWHGLRQAAVTGIDGGYGGLLATGPLSLAEERQLYRIVWRRFPDIALTSNPFAESAPLLSLAGTVSASHTYAVRLAPLPQLRRHYDKERQRAVRRYLDAGVQVRLIRRPDESDKRQFRRLYEQAAACWRLGPAGDRWTRDERWFQALWEQARRHLTLAVAAVDGAVAGMEILATQGRIATELMHVWDRRFAKQQVSTAIVEACLAFSHAQGCTYLDAVPSGPLDSLDYYKASFGAEALPIWTVSRMSPLSRALLRGQAEWRWWQALVPVRRQESPDRLIQESLTTH